MKPSTISNFEKELSKGMLNRKDYLVRKSKMCGAYGVNVDFTIKQNSYRKIGCICNSCSSVIQMYMNNLQTTHLASSHGFNPHGHLFSIQPKISGFCPVCHNFQDSFDIYDSDIAPIISILEQKVNKMNVIHTDGDRCLKLMIQYNDHYSNYGAKNIDKFMRNLPITWDVEVFGDTRDRQGTFCIVYLEKCNYVEGIHDMLEYVKTLPVSHTLKAPVRYHPEIMDIINHPYII